MKTIAIAAAVALGLAGAVATTRLPAARPNVHPAAGVAQRAATASMWAVQRQGSQPPDKIVFGRHTNSIQWELTAWAGNLIPGTNRLNGAQWQPVGGILGDGWTQFAYLAVNEEFLQPQ